MKKELINGQLQQGDMPITVPFPKWARQYVAMKRIQRFFKSHHPLALEGIVVAWDSMHHSTKPLKYVKQRISATKLVWSMYAFQLTKMTRGHVKPSEINCTYCGDHIETQDHVFKHCSAEQITSLKQKLFERIGVQLSEYMHEGTAKWLQEHVSQIWNGNHINYPDTSYGNTLKNMNLEHVSRCAWTGITPRTLVHMIEALVMPKYRKKAARIAGHVHSLTSDTLLEIWQIRTEKLQNEVLNESKTVEVPNRQLSSASRRQSGT